LPIKKEKRQSSQYDKIFKENIEAVISSIMQNVLEITAVSMEELPDDIQHTKERKPDTLKKITDDKGNTFVLQIEFQVKDEDEMVYRMGEYYFMLERKYKLPVKQFVIFLGSDNPKMLTELNRERLKFSYPIVSLATLDYHIFLNSEKPEENILGILANFKGESPESALKQILVRVKETTKGDFSLNRYFNQLRVLAQLRNLELNLKNAMDSIAEYIKEERDVLYLRGLDKGQEKEQEKFVRNLLTESDFTIEKIAQIAGVTLDFINSIQRQLSGK
jgi:DNA-dependent RNA polymerase auxiliary subunit epsilon